MEHEIFEKKRCLNTIFCVGSIDILLWHLLEGRIYSDDHQNTAFPVVDLGPESGITTVPELAANGPSVTIHL